MLIFSHGVVTIKAPIKDCGIKSDSICFSEDDLCPNSYPFKPTIETNCGVFDLSTSTIKSLYVFRLKSFWFVPGHA